MHLLGQPQWLHHVVCGFEKVYSVFNVWIGFDGHNPQIHYRMRFFTDTMKQGGT